MTAHQAALEALTRYFGYDSFRPGQQGIVEALLAGRDVLGVMPTGAGKSVCYQIPAALSPGMTLLISPLISLMRDQVDALNDLGLPAAFINTTQTPDEQAMVFAQAAAGQIKLLYVAPERLETGRFRDFAARTPISLIAVDEAHCVSPVGSGLPLVVLRYRRFHRRAAAASTGGCVHRHRHRTGAPGHRGTAGIAESGRHRYRIRPAEPVF